MGVGDGGVGACTMGLALKASRKYRCECTKTRAREDPEPIPGGGLPPGLCKYFVLSQVVVPQVNFLKIHQGIVKMCYIAVLKKKKKKATKVSSSQVYNPEQRAAVVCQPSSSSPSSAFPKDQRPSSSRCFNCL